MILTYTLAEKEYLDAQQAFKARLSPGRLLSRMVLPIALGGALAGAYSLFIVDNLGLEIGLCLGSGYLLIGRMFWWQRRVRRAIEEQPERLGPFEVELTNEGIKFSSGASELPWQVLPRYFETRDLFLLLGPDRELCILPKRAFPMGDMLQCTERLRAELKGKGARDNPDALLLKLTATWAVLALFVMASFAGSIYNLLGPAFRRASARTGAGTRRVPKPGPAKVAPMSELNGIGTVYLVPLGKPQTVLLTDLLSYYRGNYGLHLHLLAPVRLPAWTMDGTRHQLIAEELVEAMKRANPQLANDPDVILVGVTDEDMYISEMNWNYAFSWRQEERFAIVSTARLDPVIDQKPANPTRLETRTRKMITKDIGLLYYRLQPRDEFSSALYDAIGGVEDLDNMGEHFLISDTQARGERRLREQDGDPCFTIRHYYASEKNRTDAGMLGGCSGASKQLNLEIMEVDLRYGLFLDRRTEIYIPDRIPLEFTRVLRMQDSRSRAFGVGGTHNLNIFPVGDTWPFTWMDLILADGGRVHYKRSNWGVGYWDATYSETDAGSGEFSGSRVSWNWPGWKLEQPGGTSYYFPDGRHLQRPEQAALLGVEDGQGNRLNLPRDEVGGLIRAHSPNGSELTFDYDEQSRITQVRERNGIPIDYGYDSRGCLAHVKDADARVTDYSHDAKNRMITVAQNGNLILRNEYDAADRIIRQTLPGGRMYTFRYWLGHAGQVVAVEVNDSAGLAWQIKMSDGARYTLQTIRSH